MADMLQDLLVLIDNFRIYDTALTAQQVSAEYNDYVLESDCALLTLPETTDRSLTLPKTGASGMTQISWKSSASDVMKDDGTSKNLTEFEEAKVTDYAIPEAGEVAEDAVWAEKEALTQKECDAIEKQFTTPYNTCRLFVREV